VAGRALVYSDPRVIKILNERFVPVTDNCSYTQTQKDAKGEFFRLVAEQGHYAGRTKPTATRQGLYTCTAAGELLASINTTNVEKVLELLQTALEKWKQRRLNSNQTSQTEVPQSYEPDLKYHWKFPEGGLVLKTYVRDLPRDSDPNWTDFRVNFDHVWLAQEEAKSLIPDGIKVGETYQMPEAVVRRFARFHLVDTVRGESPRWRLEDLKKAEITLTVEKAKGGRRKAEKIICRGEPLYSPEAEAIEKIYLQLEGSVLNVSPPSFQTNPFSEKVVDMERGVDLQLLGYITYDKKREKFERFDLIAVGQRWGATTYNDRFNDLGPAPIGFAFELTSADSPADRTPPQAILSGYFES
jgi:hypothetical protein